MQNVDIGERRTNDSMDAHHRQVRRARSGRRLRRAEPPQVDQRIGNPFEAKVPRLYALKAKQQPLELILPGERALNHEPQLVDGGIEDALRSRLWPLSIARVLRDVGHHATVEDQTS